MSDYRMPVQRAGGPTPFCLPNCYRDHADDFEDGGWLCWTTAGSVLVKNEPGNIVELEIGGERYLAPEEYREQAVPHRVTLIAGGSLFTLTATGARDLGWLLIAQADGVDRAN